MNVCIAVTLRPVLMMPLWLRLRAQYGDLLTRLLCKLNLRWLTTNGSQGVSKYGWKQKARWVSGLDCIDPVGTGLMIGEPWYHEYLLLNSEDEDLLYAHPRSSFPIFRSMVRLSCIIVKKR